MTFDVPFEEWLLKAQTPSIRFLTLSLLQERDEADPEVKSAYQEIMETGPVPTILSGQTEAGNWHPEHSYYTPKYVSTHWSMLLLNNHIPNWCIYFYPINIMHSSFFSCNN